MSRSTAPSRSCLAILTIALSVSVCVGAGSAGASDDDQRAQLEMRLERLLAEVEETEARAAALNDALVDLAGDDARVRAEFEAASVRLSALERQMVADEDALATLVAQQDALRAARADEERRMASILGAIQRMGRRPPPAVVEAETPMERARSAIVLNATLPALEALSRELAAQAKAAEALAAQERDNWARLRTDVTALVEERSRLGALREEMERRRALSVYERDEVTAALARLAEEAASVRELIDAVGAGRVETLIPLGGFAQRRGNLSLPVAGRVIGTFGDPLPAGGLSEGISLAALPGSTVFAPMPGTVLFSDQFRSYGNVLILDAGDGYHMVLVGLHDVFTGAGNAVDTGAPLGRMGRTAPRASTALSSVGAGEQSSADRTERPTLYVELRRDGRAFDSHGWWREASRQLGRTVE